MKFISGPLVDLVSFRQRKSSVDSHLIVRIYEIQTYPFKFQMKERMLFQ